MSVAVGVDVGASLVKVATADSNAARAAYTAPREREFPELISRVGTRVPHVGRDGNQVVTRQAEDLFVQEARVAVGQLGDAVRGDGAGLTIIAPDWWTRRAHASVREALREWGLERATLESSAVAAVRGYRGSVPSVPATVAVLDLGAHTCSASIVTDCQGDDIRRVGHTSALHGRGGDDLDARILHHVLAGLRGQGLTYDPDDIVAVEAARDLLRQCRDAKEALSVRPVVTLSPSLAGAPAQFRLVRAEHDDVARPAIREIVQVLKDCLAGGEHEVEAVLLVGGGAPIPVLAQQISVELGLPVLLDADPSSLAARGAALQALASLPTKRGSRRPTRRPSGWRLRARARRAADTMNDGRHRGARAGVAAAYAVIVLAAIGHPASSEAGTANPDQTPVLATNEGGTPSDLLPGIHPRPKVSPSVPDEVAVDSPVTAGSTLPAAAVATTPAPTKAPQSSAASSSSGSSSSSDAGSGADATEVPEPSGEEPADPPPSGEGTGEPTVDGGP